MLKANVVFATMTGNNEEVANIVCEALTNKGVEVNETEISQTDVEDFKQADILVVCAYTYDEGAMPEEGMDFYDDLKETDLTGKVFGVAGSGDKFYGEYFNKTVDHFDEAFEKAGATRGAEKVKIDLEPYEEDIEQLTAFAESLVNMVNKKS
ncbi:flavodoxin [Lactobacillus sp. 3B(2020)]|uniref:flavodoxin n=1 Tax=Lactobacillus sp. 3B(2020) TaxID=2695882 RepID=UPI0015DF92C4|nr:flavodoxin [Lactobacillus sp. 3B(2020)]QLL70947.1 flavodoxin [Lactobacillus sp. 3B(2020)]